MTYNLFDTELLPSQIEEILSRHRRQPLLPPLGSEAWKRASQNAIVARLLKPLRASAEQDCAEALPELSDDLYSDFRRTGARLRFETVYFERRRRLALAAVSFLLCGEDDCWRERLLASMVSKLTSIFEEVSWALPAHVNWDNQEDESGKDPLQIDLFCAETANLMAEMIDLFGAILPAELQTRIKDRLDSAIFKNFRDRSFGWMKSSHNWNAVCHQGVIGAALSQLDDPHLLSELLVRARNQLPAYLSGFGADGACSEGPGYWSYGFGWFAVLNEQLETRTGGELSLFEGDEHITEIARYGPRVVLSGGNLVNFADGGATGGLRPSLLAFLGQRLNEPDCVASALEQYRRVAESGIDLALQRCDLFYLVRLFLFCPQDLPASDARVVQDCFLPDLAVLISHGTDSHGHHWEFAAKAGHNGEHHNHNDCGSFIINVDAVRLITEIGAPEYVRDFFSEKRYEFLAARTLGHSLPVINGCEQAAGEEHGSKVVSRELADTHAGLVVDVTACYPSAAGCRSFLRTFHFDKHQGKVTLEDAFELDQTEALESAIITCQSVTLGENQAVIEGDGIKLVLRPTSGARLDRVESHAYQDHSGTTVAVNRIVLVPEVLVPVVRIGVEIQVEDSLQTPTSINQHDL